MQVSPGKPTMQVASPQTQAPGPPGAYTIDGSPASRRQYLQQSPQSGETPRAQSSTRSGSSPHSSKRPSRRPSDNAPQLGNSENAPVAQYQSPPSAHLSASNTPRAPDISMVNQSTPLSSSTVASSPYQQSRREGRGQQQQQRGPPFEPPTRTSSNQRAHGANLSPNPSSSERTVPYRSTNRAGDDRPSSSRTANTSGGRNLEDRGNLYPESRVAGNELEVAPDAASVAAAAARSRRRGPASPEGPQRAISTRETGAHQSPSAVQSRSASSVAVAMPPARPPKEASPIINRVVVTDPQIDIEREQERQAEAVPDLGRVASENVEDGGRGTGQRRQDYSTSAARRKDTKFGEYVLGQTLGEGEFGKVKLGWKKDGSVQVAIKLIRRESLGTNPSRLPKIYREISILRELSHPNIVRLHEMVETDKYIGIILEYASGGELFDYILTHRYLKDHAARKLFAQLVSGVGYLHKKGIVHRDLKLENLLLDRNRNIIITDFGFANTFNPRDELSDEIEYNLTNRDFVKRHDLERIVNGSRKGDLMQTSCGSPCYAAPELVVTDSLYTGRKVDVWSCGVILYAMLAGYLPFDDDPANPEGDNINLLYKYIVSTPLTFPEYVTPHARDLLRRILVPDPRKRADLFEVARHSWLSEYAHVVSHVTSSTTTVGEIANATITSDQQDAPLLARSASVREPTKTQPSNMSPVGGLSHQGKLDPEQSVDRTKPPRDKRRTVQVEYVAPQSQTVRGEGTPSVQSPATVGSASAAAPSSSKTRARAGSEGPEGARQASAAAAMSKPLPQEPSIADYSLPYHPGFLGSTKTQQRPGGPQQVMAPPARPTKDVPRSTSDYIGFSGPLSTSTVARPTTGGSMSSAGRLPSRGNSYSQPLAPTVAATNAQGRLAQPKNGKQYNISGPIPQTEYYFQEGSIGRPSTQQYGQPVPLASRQDQSRGHKRSNTLGSVFSRSGSFFGSRSQAPQEQVKPQQEKKYPPTSMKAPIASDSPRQSTDSRRSSSFGFGRKNSDLRRTGDAGKQEKPRRFSLLPASFSFKSFTGNAKDQSTENILPVSERRPSAVHQQPPTSRGQARPSTMAYGRGQSQSNNPRNEESLPAGYDGYDGYDGQRERARENSTKQARRSNAPSRNTPQPQQTTYGSLQYISQQDPYPSIQAPAGQSYLLGESGPPTESEVSLGISQQRAPYPHGFGEYDEEPRPSMQQIRSGRGAGVLQKDNRRFADAYEQGQGGGHHAGSSGAAKRVMDFFRRRGKARAGDERV